MQVQIPWDVSNMFGDYLSEETDGADDEEVAAYEDSKKRLKVRVPPPLPLPRWPGSRESRLLTTFPCRSPFAESRKRTTLPRR